MKVILSFSRFIILFCSPLLFSYPFFPSFCLFFSFVMLLHSMLSRQWVPWPLTSFLQIESCFFLFVIVFWFSFYSHVLQSPTILLFSCFGCAIMPPTAPTLSSCHHHPYGDLASPTSDAGGRRTTLCGSFPNRCRI